MDFYGPPRAYRSLSTNIHKEAQSTSWQGSCSKPLSSVLEYDVKSFRCNPKSERCNKSCLCHDYPRTVVVSDHSHDHHVECFVRFPSNESSSLKLRIDLMRQCCFKILSSGCFHLHGAAGSLA
ncbi:hypothetical protein QL285_015695 [Trifolium repens]|nr:hypothetical protein QL285_015695 [Trifolium repens]